MDNYRENKLYVCKIVYKVDIKLTVEWYPLSHGSE